MARDGLRETAGGIDRGNGIALKAGWSSAWVAIVLAVALASLPAAAIVNLAAQDGGTATQLRATVLSSTPSVLGASGGRGLVPSEASPVPGVGWEALSHASNGLSPPDVQIAVGPDHVVEAVNSALGIYTKLGAAVTNTNLSSLFASGSDPVGVPRIQYMVSTVSDPANPVSVILQSFAVTGSPPGTVQVTVSDHQLAATAQLPPPAPQRGSFYNLDTGDFRIVDALWSRGLLWLSFND